MPPVVSRILISAFMLPLAALVYLAAFVLSDHWVSPMYMYVPNPLQMLIGGCGAWLTVALIHYFTWRKQVTWSRRRIANTFLSVAASIVLAAAAGVVLGHEEDSDVGFFMASALSPVLWLLSTALIWRDTPMEFLARQSGASGPIRCPVCKYNLRGLTEARCPECGTAFTLDQLFAAQNESSNVVAPE